MADLPNLDQVQKILNDLIERLPDAYEEVCKVCDLLGLRHPPDPR